MNEIPDKDDIGTVRRQLESKSVSIINIIERCRHGYPRIVLLDPSVNVDGCPALDYQSATNILWLTCPYLNRKIHELESKKIIKKIEELIGSDPGLNILMRNAHARFYFLRKKVCRIAGISAEDFNDLFVKGIGGITNFSTLKCLHIHYAHSLICSDNIAGKIVFRLLGGNIWCDEICCKITEKYDSCRIS